MSMTVAVAGATGRFGAICRLLLERGHRVRALTRSPTSSAAAVLRRLGAEVTFADLDDPVSLKSAMEGADSTFSSGTLHKAGPDGELRHGRNIAEAAATARIAHLVYVSGAGAGPHTGVPIFDVKGEVERHIESVEVPHTIVAPVYFMENLLNPWNLAALETGEVVSYLPADRALQQVPVVDVIRFAAMVLEQRERFAGQRIEIASDAPTTEEMADTMSRVLGRPYIVSQISAADLGPGLSALFEWLARTGHHVDIEGLRRRYPELGWHMFDEWMTLLAAIADR